MKKTYQKPEMQVFAINNKQPLMAGSINQDGDNLNINVGGDDMGSGTINARGYDWGDEDE
ncbi:MAG: hypothetical protein ILA25_02260 [Prevotella sp.]|nr:hypothetical protein [Prevotella sp.]